MTVSNSLQNGASTLPKIGSQVSNETQYVNIDTTGNYFNTREQVKKRNKNTFTDAIRPYISGSSILGLFEVKSTTSNDSTIDAYTYPTGSSVTDSSGNTRKILDSSYIDLFTSSSLDTYKNGIEITLDKHWTTGLAKITSGNPGHLTFPLAYGVNQSDLSVTLNTYFTSSKDSSGNSVFFLAQEQFNSSSIDNSGNVRRLLNDRPLGFYEIEVYDPVDYIKSADKSKFTYPIITSDSNQTENFILNGIIEPFPIRPVISKFSINFPFEPQGTRGSFGSGNESTSMSSDQVKTIDYRLPNRVNKVPWYDSLESTTIVTTGTVGTGSVPVSNVGYQLIDSNVIPPFEDVIYPRGQIPSSSYPSQLLEVVNGMSPEETSYITRKEFSATCGFMYDNAFEGTDSIAYGGLLY
jgi:hypothetical protein